MRKAASRATVLELQEVRFAYPGGPEILRGLSLAVEEGRIAVLLGPNGAGKSTLLDVCLGWLAPSAGTVLLRGRPLSGWSRRERGRFMSLVPQRENVRFDFTVLEYVLLGRAPHLPGLGSPAAADLRTARAALAEAGIADLEGRSVATLSGGEYQLMLIARSLAQEPSLLILDEPASQLDPAHRLLVTRLLGRLAGRGIAVLATSHDPQAVSACDAVHLMKDGRILLSGAPRAAMTGPLLTKVYGVPLRVRWVDGSPHVTGA